MGFLTSGALGGISQFPASLSLKGMQGKFFSFQLLSFLSTVDGVEVTLLFTFASIPMLTVISFTFCAAQQPSELT